MLKLRQKSGFTLIELVLVLLLVGLVASEAIPYFNDMRTDAKNGTTQAGLGAMRSAISVAESAIALREDSGTPKYPTYSELSTNTFDANHPHLSGQNILDPSSGIPANPWTISTAPTSSQNKIFNCVLDTQGTLLGFPNADQGWCYNSATGQIWANSNLNGGGAGKTENTY